MKTIVTGATGFLGRRLVRQLVEDGMEVRCAVRASSKLQGLRDFVGPRLWPQVEIVRVDLMDPDVCRKILEDGSTLYHLAAALSGCAATMFRDTVTTTRHLLDACRDIELRRFVLVSSLGVYGAQELKRNSVLDETCRIDPLPQLRDPYTYSKVVQEEVAWRAYVEYGLPLVVIRPGVIFGDERGCMSNRVGLRLGRLVLRMGGHQTLPYVYVENCARAVALAGICPGVEGQAINVVDDDLPSGRELIRRCRQSGMRFPVVPVPGWAIGPLSCFNEWYSRHSQSQIPAVLTRHRSAAMWKPLQFSNEKAKKLLGWLPDVPFDQALRKSLCS